MSKQNNRDERPVQIFENCTDCGECVTACESACITKKAAGDKTLVFDYSICTGCSVCSITCPEAAIEMIPEPDEE